MVPDFPGELITRCMPNLKQYCKRGGDLLVNSPFVIFEHCIVIFSNMSTIPNNTESALMIDL